jgi:hypothetical protein
MTMDQNCVTNALLLSKRVGILLHETLDLSQQLGEALDRNDQVSVKMLISMRAEPIHSLKTVDRALKDLEGSIADPKDRRHMKALLNGQEAHDENEQALTAQSESNANQLKRVLELDRRLNLKIGHEKSYYK